MAQNFSKGLFFIIVVCSVYFSRGLCGDNGSFEFYAGGVYAAKVPTVKSVLGYEIGERMTNHAGIEKYIHALAQTSERVRLYRYGESYEGRILYYLVLSAPDNLGKLDRIKADMAKLADPRKLRDANEAEQIIKASPAITWLSYGVHGNEHSSTEAALLTAYQLAAGEDEVTKKILDSTLVIIDPAQNPDGRERFINYYYSVVGLKPNPDQNAAEHNEGWPSGRFNHYLFDLNRDWFFLTQRETAAKVKAFLEWHPQVFVDLHEMGSNSTYYFAPPALPINFNFPEMVRRWWTIYGRANAEAFDKLGFDYYTREVYDAFYPGYGDSWPTFNGAVGMTYEQASARGLVVRRRDETTFTLRDAAWHHFTASMATCRTTALHREERLRDYHLFYKTAIEEGARGPIKEVLITESEENLNAAKLVDVLMRQGIELKQAPQEFSNKVRNFVNDTVEEKRFAKGTYVIRMAQPQKRLIQALFEKEAKLDEKFIAEEMERRKNKLPNRFYDVTAWSIPLAYGVEVYLAGEPSRVRLVDVKETPEMQGRVAGEKASYAYMLRYNSNNVARVLARLLSEGYRVHVAREPFRLNGEKFERGTLILKVSANASGLHERVTQLEQETGVHFHATSSGWTEEGINLGSENVIFLKRPKIAVAYAEPTSPASYGWIAYLLEQRYGLDFTPVRTSSLPQIDLKEYNVIILPHGAPEGYKKTLGEEGAKRLKAWVVDGGTLVTVKGATAFAAEKGVEWTSSRLIKDLKKLRKEEAEGPGERPEEKERKEKEKEKEEEVPDEDRPDVIPGAILRVKLSPTHFLTFGYDRFANVLIQSSYIFTPSKHGINVGTFVDDEQDLKVSGFIWDKMKKALPKKAYLIDEAAGRGHVILYADDPNFRAYWDGLNRLFLNSLFFGPSLQR